MIAAVRTPSRAAVSAPYVTPPPSRQPRRSSEARSRDAEPTTRSSGDPRVYLAPTSRTSTGGVSVFFYELHEGDEEVFSDLLLVHETEIDPDEFFELVQGIRRRVLDTYEDDTLIESIARELEREHGFIYISDERLTAAANVSVVEEENFLVSIDDAGPDALDRDVDYRAVIAEFDPDGDPETRPN
jgi:hypothetical protein